MSLGRNEKIIISIFILDQFSDTSEVQRFFTILGSGSPEEVPDADAGGDDAEFENNENKVVTLYKVSDASGKMRLDKVATKPLAQTLLDTNVRSKMILLE